MQRIVITRIDPRTWRWETGHGHTGHAGIVEQLSDGRLQWPPDATGYAVTVVLALALYSNPPDRILYEADSDGYRLTPGPPPRRF